MSDDEYHPSPSVRSMEADIESVKDFMTIDSVLINTV